MSFSIRNLLRNLFPGNSGSYIPSPNMVLPPPPPSPPPDGVSCFAKGIAKSLQEEGEKVWRNTPLAKASRDGWYPGPVVDVEHSTHGIRVIAFGHNWRVEHCGLLLGCSYISGIRIEGADEDGVLNDADTLYIARAIEEHPLGQLREDMDFAQKEQARKATAKTYFESLGCPPPSP